MYKRNTIIIGAKPCYPMQELSGMTHAFSAV